MEVDNCRLEIDGDRYIVRVSRLDPETRDVQSAEMALGAFRELIHEWRDFFARHRHHVPETTPTV